MHTRISILLLAVSAASLVGLASAPHARPTSRFTVTCAAGARQCTFDGSSSDSSATGKIVSYLYDWGNGRSELRTLPTASNTWPAGSYCVRLTVTDASGLTSYSTKYITVPYVAGTVFKACATAPPPSAPVKVDTVTIVKTDTLWRLRVDTVVRTIYDTVRIVRVDTIRLPAPPPVHDTTIVTKHDTLGISVTLPVFPNVNGLYVDSLWVSQGYRVFKLSLLGMLARNGTSSWEAYRNPGGWPPPIPNGAMQLGIFRSQGVYPSLAAAIAALDAPPPP